MDFLFPELCLALWKRQMGGTHSEQSSELKASCERHLHLSGGREVQLAPDLHVRAVTVVLRTHTHTLWETLLFNSTVILTLTGSFSLTSCDRWVRSSGVTGLLILTWGSVQRDPAACWEEEEDSVIMVTSNFNCCFANLGQNIKKAAEHSKSETRRQDRKRETLRLQ